MRSCHRAATFALGACSLALLSSCQGKRFTSAQVLGGVTISADDLNHGQAVYARHCASCHGIKGDGRGSSSAGMTPAPRDFTRGQFKFTSSADGGLPSDDDLARTVRRGLKGTHMPGWAKVSERDLSDVVHYLKTFSSRWSSERPQRLLAPGPDPWLGNEANAVGRGETVYHAQAQCWTCHPSYLPSRRIEELTRTMEPRTAEAPEPVPWRREMQQAREVTTDYGADRPPDFLRDPLKSDERDEDLLRSVAAGIGGTPMPGFHARLSDRDLWAVVHYLRALQRKRGTPEAAALRRDLPAEPSGTSVPAGGR